MNFCHDLALISKENLKHMGISPPKEWDDHKICLNYSEIRQRFFYSFISYSVKYSKQLKEKLSSLTLQEQKAVEDIEERLKNCQTIIPYLSNSLIKTDVKDSDFLLKIGIYTTLI